MTMIYLYCDEQNNRFARVQGKEQSTTLQNLVNYINTGFNNKTINNGRSIEKDIETEYIFEDNTWNPKETNELIIKIDNTSKPLFADLIEILNTYTFSNINNINMEKIKAGKEIPKALTTFVDVKPAKELKL